ncbi:endolytic transglycosylase MltG [Roseivirga pacifica]|uniref:endolytic transglycosylase MltG n=1 Tax=Roseivirga pacifica TaxID=1267423 RepID=UPI0020964F85|nr:endolytic transglycosylase MltG [Roseivirga pacifica]MCO6358636.1 endolytic transglycosylase MltG [Roseivirga pacifica]MCO6365728.1 endolytic transglycosylase MltG [Roseivirga pacifica]MCO6371542.1 endolytic transglycosylase MltG [Roseivirga pacifica]MCO6376347.1 endolytic transglycosylase MltG [Roseivirga pacifica]MCO6378920.1 endolytic transglycosylase MltG [Roseivirga pacifica]
MKKRKRLLLGMIIFSVLLTSFSFYFYQLFFGVNVLAEKNDTTILIDRDDTFDSLRNRLYDEQIIEDALSFSFVSKVLGYQDAIKPGVYLLSKDMNNLEAVRKLRAGDQIPVNITFNNVRLKPELAEKITANTGVSTDEFLALLNNEDYIADFGFNEATVIGMFIPNTYEVYWTISAEALFERMNKEYKAFWNDSRKQKAEAIGLSPAEVSTLASIVQAESIMGDESPTIAGLYINRLNKNILLQADPTVKFALGDFEIQRVLTADTRVDSPYNTYRYKGLPPGPINLPTISSINAVLNYKKHDYIYMCAKEDFSGYHRFAKTLVEHNKNARLFQQALNRRNIYR